MFTVHDSFFLCWFGVNISDSTINHLIGNWFKNCISFASNDKNTGVTRATWQQQAKYFICHSGVLLTIDTNGKMLYSNCNCGGAKKHPPTTFAATTSWSTSERLEHRIQCIAKQWCRVLHHSAIQLVDETVYSWRALTRHRISMRKRVNEFTFVHFEMQTWKFNRIKCDAFERTSSGKMAQKPTYNGCNGMCMRYNRSQNYNPAKSASH